MNPQEDVWANLRLGLVNLKPLLGGTDGLIDGFLAETKLTFDQT
ncbi:hypothetical protein ACIQOU_30800 [Streptomyces sp. NPDC091279]